MPRQTIPADYKERIKTLRVKFGLTQVGFAEILGVSFATVNRWENGQSRPSQGTWRKILRGEKFGIEALDEDSLFKAVERQDGQSESFLPDQPPKIDFSAESDIVWAVSEGKRLSYGHLFNPSFATETALIDPLPHQWIAVYERMLPQTRLRFLLADDAGAGKTIMAGLYIREMLARRLIRRVLVVPPAGLVGNWEREMRVLFSLDFRIIVGNDAKSSNPFVGQDSNLSIVSVDTLCSENVFSRLQEKAVVPYDLVVFDEAHKLSASRHPDLRIRKTDRYRLAEAFAGIDSGDERWRLEWSAQHLLLLTATPHMGKDFPYYCLWRLLEPEILSTDEAFSTYPPEARSQHFIRRTKEEMVFFNGDPIYPTRISDTLSYDLKAGDISEQSLYDETTDYLRTLYNRARILNRSAARLAMSVFQRRLVSSTYALRRSFERRFEKLSQIIEDLKTGRITIEQLQARQRDIDRFPDILDTLSADEEIPERGMEQNEIREGEILEGGFETNLAQLEIEKERVEFLLNLARQVEELGEESKFETLREVLRDPKYSGEKFIVFTEHRDTLEYLVRRLEGLGFTGQVAQIHGGMGYKERDEQVEFFRRPSQEKGARYLVATDAAGEGINLQFCWLMVNYDVPWNPARLEQRMGRIHRYGQKHDRVCIINLVAGKTREGRVIRTLLEKLENIRKELGSDKVFDVIGRLFENVSIRTYMAQAVMEEDASAVEDAIQGKLTKEQVEAIRQRENRLYGDGGDVKSRLQQIREDMEQNQFRRLLPGFVRRYTEKAVPLLDLEIEGDLSGLFSLFPRKPAALDPLLSSLEAYRLEQRNNLTVHRPKDRSECIWLHPGDPLFERICALVASRFSEDALRGSVFIDPTASKPYLFHLAQISVVRKADENFPTLAKEDLVQVRLVGLKQEQGGPIEECPVEHLLLLKGGQGVPLQFSQFAATGANSRDLARSFAVDEVAKPLAEKHRQIFLQSVPSREAFLIRGYDYQEAELAARRAAVSAKASQGDAQAKTELARIRQRQQILSARRDQSIQVLYREPELIAPGDVTFLAHALVVPSSDPEDRKRHDSAIEEIAVQISRSFEESLGAVVQDVSKSHLARAVGLESHPGFDLLTKRPDGVKYGIEVKGRAQIGDVELSENEWAKACTLREKYWLYVVYDCASSNPRLLRIQDPFMKLLARVKGTVVIGEQEIFNEAERESNV